MNLGFQIRHLATAHVEAASGVPKASKPHASMFGHLRASWEFFGPNGFASIFRGPPVLRGGLGGAPQPKLGQACKSAPHAQLAASHAELTIPRPAQLMLPPILQSNKRSQPVVPLHLRLWDASMRWQTYPSAPFPEMHVCLCPSKRVCIVQDFVFILPLTGYLSCCLVGPMASS